MTSKVLIWNTECHRFLYSWQNTELVPCTKMKSLDTTCFKTAWDNKLVLYQWYFQSIHQTQSSLTYQMPTLLSKEHVISGSHPYNLLADETHLTLQNSSPSDPDCSGQPTHSQPCCMLVAYKFHFLKRKHQYLKELCGYVHICCQNYVSTLTSYAC